VQSKQTDLREVK